MKYFTKEVRIGLVGIVSLCVLIYGINYLKGIHLFKPSIYFYVKYENINGLTKSSPVYADGYQVGIVRDIFYDYKRPGNVTVEIDLDKEMQIPRGSYADLEVAMLGDVKMNIILSDGQLGVHTIGDTIPGKFNNGLMGSINSLMPKIESLIPKLDTILTSIQAITGNEEIPEIITNVKYSTANLQALTSNLNRFAQNDLPLLTQKLSTIGDNFTEVSNNLKNIDYAATVSKVDATLNNVKMLTEKLNSKENSLGLLLNDTQLYYNLNNTAENAANLLGDFKNSPKRYVHFSLFGKKDK
ncbi:MlaD family protein [Bacteroides sp. 519]|uniref:MlaD family protein n=1 Tax=Bacteroides sp. 519 TaxID=2302937 RepID=UPI0013D4CEFD|nr:MlaD family protein [Bacteroides sp. 519]NDV59276.1 MCE family protein [Bacteroides sp. 519]